MKVTIVALAASCAVSTAAFAMQTNIGADFNAAVQFSRNDSGGVHPPQFGVRDSGGVHPPQFGVRDSGGVHPPQFGVRDSGGVHPPL